MNGQGVPGSIWGSWETDKIKMSTVFSMLYRVILWIGVCTGAVVFVVIWPTGHLLQKKNDEMHVCEQHICAHCDFDVCAFSAICEFITAKTTKM